MNRYRYLVLGIMVHASLLKECFFIFDGAGVGDLRAKDAGQEAGDSKWEIARCCYIVPRLARSRLLRRKLILVNRSLFFMFSFYKTQVKQLNMIKYFDWRSALHVQSGL